MSFCKKCAALLCALNLSLSLCACSGGSIYSNYREIEELMIVRTMGFDLSDEGIRLSVSAGASGNGADLGENGASGSSALHADAPGVSLAMGTIQDYSAREDLFFAHTSYLVVGESAARSGLDPIFSFIKRSAFMRLDVPVFVVLGGDASTLILGAENPQYSATEVLRSIERNVKKRGDCIVSSAGELSAELAASGSALICAVKLVSADAAMSDAQALTAIPAGYAVIKDGKMVGSIPMESARVVNLLMNETGPSEISVSTGGCTACVQFDKSSVEYSPRTENGVLCGIDVSLTLSAALIEFSGSYDEVSLNAALEDTLYQWTSEVLDTAAQLGCDFLRLGNTLERQSPEKLHGISTELESLLPELQYNIYVDAQIERSFDLALPDEDRG